MALALDKPIISVPTLEGLAYRMAGFSGVICPLMDARRNQVYTGIYQITENQLKCLLGQSAMDIQEIVEKVNDFGQNVVFLGDGVPVYETVIKENVLVPYQFAPLHLNRQSAAAVAALGALYMAEGRTEDAREHKPVYLRQSQAEREREKRMQQGT